MLQIEQDQSKSVNDSPNSRDKIHQRLRLTIIECKWQRPAMIAKKENKDKAVSWVQWPNYLRWSPVVCHWRYDPSLIRFVCNSREYRSNLYATINTEAQVCEGTRRRTGSNVASPDKYLQGALETSTAIKVAQYFIRQKY